VAGLVTHLHRDHADAGALAAALAPGAPLLEPPAGGGDATEQLGVAQAEHELAAAGLERRRLAPWESVTAGPFTLTALPASDGIGDPQVAWLVEADGVRVLHLGDTMFHGYWWRMARRHGPFDVVLAPVNGAVVGFPHRRPASPLPVAMDPAEAAIAAGILGAGLAIPIHAEGYEIDGIYQAVPDAAERFVAAAAERDVPARILAVGETFEIPAVAMNRSGFEGVRS
jgi:L-ascorbate metabolism protein UlaG (beta-lactamase superfamily)